MQNDKISTESWSNSDKEEKITNLNSEKYKKIIMTSGICMMAFFNIFACYELYHSLESGYYYDALDIIFPYTFLIIISIIYFIVNKLDKKQMVSKSMILFLLLIGPLIIILPFISNDFIHPAGPLTNNAFFLAIIVVLGTSILLIIYLFSRVIPPIKKIEAKKFSIVFFIFLWFPAYSYMIILSFGLLIYWFYKNMHIFQISSKKFGLTMVCLLIMTVSPFLITYTSLTSRYSVKIRYDFDNKQNFNQTVIDSVNNFPLSNLRCGNISDFSSYVPIGESARESIAKIIIKQNNAMIPYHKFGRLGFNWQSHHQLKIDYSFQRFQSQNVSIFYNQTNIIRYKYNITNYTMMYIYIDQIYQEISYHSNLNFSYINQEYFPYPSQLFIINESVVFVKIRYVELWSSCSQHFEIWFIVNAKNEILIGLTNIGMTACA